MTHDHAEAKKLVAEIEAGLEGVTPGPWEVFDGCSWRRIGTRHPNYMRGNYDTAVLAPYKASDGHPDLMASSGDRERNLAHIIRCDPDNMRTILDSYRALEASGDDLNKLIKRAQNLLRMFLEPGERRITTEKELVSALLEHFDGPEQRRVQGNWMALNQGGGDGE